MTPCASPTLPKLGRPRDHRLVSKEVSLHIVSVRVRGLEAEISVVGPERWLIADFAISFGIDEAAGNQRVQRG